MRDITRLGIDLAKDVGPTGPRVVIPYLQQKDKKMHQIGHNKHQIRHFVN